MPTRRDFIQHTGLLAGAAILQGLTANGGAPLSSAAEIRSQLLVSEGRIYLNTGSLGPSPRHVLDAVVDAMKTLEKNPVSENWGPLGQAMESVRSSVADFIHADVKEVLLTRNTTEGLSLVCQVLPLQENDEILTTTLEHGGGEVGLEYLVKLRGAKLRRVELPLPPRNPEEIISVIEQAITPRTRLIMVSHVNTVTGLLMPISKISKVTAQRGIYLLVDGAQAPGLVPVDVKELGADAYASSGHKWLLGPKETGFLYLRTDFPGTVPPVFAFNGHEAYTQSSGTRNVATIIGLGKALEWHSKLDIAKTHDYTVQLRNYCFSRLKAIGGIRVLSPEHPDLVTGIVSFELLHRKNSDVYARLKELDIIVKVLPQHNAIRISCHVFVSREDVDTFLNALQKLT